MVSTKKDTKSQETVSTSEEKQDLPSVCLVSSEPFLVEPPHGSSIRNRPAKIDLKAFYGMSITLSVTHAQFSQLHTFQTALPLSPDMRVTMSDLKLEHTRIVSENTSFVDNYHRFLSIA